MTSAIPYDEQPAWKDVKPVPQDDGPFPVVPINYSTEYSNAMNYFRAISLANEMSPRALELTGHIVELNSSHYTVWEYRKRLLLALNVDLESEIELLDRLLTDQPKNYQMWHHREVVIRELGDPTGELDFLASIFADDAKNYHAWLFRQWLVKHFKLWDRELQFINDMLMSDVRNNSAWNYRFFYYAQSPSSLVSGDAASVEQEVSFVLDKIRLAPSNESPWEYLRGLMRALKLPLDSNPALVRFCEDLVEKQCQSRHLYSFLVDLYSASTDRGQRAKAADICLHLADVLDPIRKGYWKMRHAQIVSQQ